MTTTQGAQMLAAFHYVRDVFRNAARMLESCAPLLQEHRFTPYGRDWKPFEMQREHTAPQLWLPQYAVRQFHQESIPERTILTVGAFFWDDSPRETVPFVEPLAIVSFMQRQEHSMPDTVYWLGLLQAWTTGCPADGNVRSVTNQVDAYGEFYRQNLSSQSILTVALPLMEVSSSEQLYRSLIAPLVAKVEEVGK